MKNHTLAYLGLAFAAASLVASPIQAVEYKLIVIAGQSNSGDWSYWGAGPFPAGVQEWIKSPNCDALILTDNGDANAEDESLVTMHQQQAVEGSQGYAQIVAFAANAYWKAINPDSRIVVVKKSVGATPIGFWTAAGRNTLNPWANGTPPWSLYYAEEGAGHAMLFSRVKKAKSLLAPAKVEGVGFLWYQGEGNAGESDGNYHRLLLDLVDGATMVHDPITPAWGDDPSITATKGVRQELGNPDMPVVVARISSEFIGWGSNFGPSNWEPGRQTIRADIVNVSRELTPAAFVDVDDRPVNDQYHYVGSELAIIGERFASAWKQLANCPVVHPKGLCFSDRQQIAITTPPGGVTVHYTLDGSTPGPTSTAYEKPFMLDRSATIKAVACRGGQPVGPVVERRYARLAPLAAQTPAATAPGLRVRAYDSRTIFPNFETAGAPFNPTAVTQTRIARNLLANYGWFNLLCTGYLTIPQDGVYEFRVTTRGWRHKDPDYRLAVDDVPIERQVALKAGLHGFRFTTSTQGILSIAIRGGPYTDFTVIPPSMYSHETGQDGTPVSFEPSRLSVALPAVVGTTESICVTSDIANWTASSDQSWLAILPASGAYHETLTLTAQVNNTRAERNATVTLAGVGAVPRVFTVTQAAADAAPMDSVISSPVEGATTTLPITTPGPWSLSHESDPWFDCEPSAGVGNAKVTLRARKNYLTTDRIGHMRLDIGMARSQRLRVRQSGETAYLSPSATRVALTGVLNGPAVEFDGILTRSNVTWTATSTASWLRLSDKGDSTQIGYDNGRVWFHTTEANPAAQPRQATVTLTADKLPPQTITVIQPGSAPFLEAMPKNVIINRGDAATFVVASNQASWSAASDQPWLTVAKAHMPNRLILKAEPINDGGRRMAHVTVTAGNATPVVVSVTQQPRGMFINVDPGVIEIGGGAGQEATVCVDADQAWTVTSVSAPWLAAAVGTPVTNAMAEPLLREHTPALLPATERKLTRLLLRVKDGNKTGADRQAQVVLTSTGGATATAIVVQTSDTRSPTTP